MITMEPKHSSLFHSRYGVAPAYKYAQWRYLDVNQMVVRGCVWLSMLL